MSECKCAWSIGVAVVLSVFIFMPEFQWNLSSLGKCHNTKSRNWSLMIMIKSDLHFTSQTHLRNGKKWVRKWVDNTLYFTNHHTAQCWNDWPLWTATIFYFIAGENSSIFPLLCDWSMVNFIAQDNGFVIWNRIGLKVNTFTYICILIDPFFAHLNLFYDGKK